MQWNECVHISLSFSPIGAELVVSIRWWITLAPGYISHHPLARLYFAWKAWHWYSRWAVVTRILAGELMQKVAEMCTCQSLASKCPWRGTSYKDLCVNRGQQSLTHTHRRSSYHCLRHVRVYPPCRSTSIQNWPLSKSSGHRSVAFCMSCNTFHLPKHLKVLRKVT